MKKLLRYIMSLAPLLCALASSAQAATLQQQYYRTDAQTATASGLGKDSNLGSSATFQVDIPLGCKWYGSAEFWMSREGTFTGYNYFKIKDGSIGMQEWTGVDSDNNKITKHSNGSWGYKGIRLDCPSTVPANVRVDITAMGSHGFFRTWLYLPGKQLLWGSGGLRRAVVRYRVDLGELKKGVVSQQRIFEGEPQRPFSGEITIVDSGGAGRNKVTLTDP